jgi:hypothetical protein
MSNRLEQEFPHTSWRAIPPVGPRGLGRDSLGRSIARGYGLHSRGVGKSMRVAGAGLARAAGALAALVRWPRAWPGPTAGRARGLPQARAGCLIRPRA